MNVLVCHNFYQQSGGEDQVFAEEVELLARGGHRVERFTLHNDELLGPGSEGTSARLRLMGKTLWNRDAYRVLLARARAFGADLVHFHNTFPLMSPAALYAARRSGAAVVQTLHNYRLLCANAMFLRDGAVCEQCLGRLVPWPAVLHNCYRGSRAATGAAAAMLTLHRAAGTWRSAIDLYIALTNFSRDKFVRGGLPEAKLAVKPNFVGLDRGAGDGAGDEAGPFALFAGRLDASKGLDVLLSAWRQLPADPRYRLKIMGDGPLAGAAREAAAGDRRIQFLGRRPLDEVMAEMGRAACFVVSSVWYEGLPRTIVESFCKGTPVVAAAIGSLAELVTPGRNGLHFKPGDADDLAGQLRTTFDDPARLSVMRLGARLEYEGKFTADANYRQLMDLYARALAARHPSRSTPLVACV